MIKVDRSRVPAPAGIASQDAARLSALERQAEAGALNRDSFEPSIYSSEEVREALWTMQHYKCCFCEREYERKWSSAEHFRAKTEVDRGSGKETGYWWLAYEFRNLYFCCMACNRNKGIHFPLEPGSPMLVYPELPWPEGDVRPSAAKSERPLLIDPGFEDPADHLTFVEFPGGEWQIAPRNGSERGRETIRKVGLDRDDLDTLRRKHFKKHLKPLLEDFWQAGKQSNALAVEQVRRRARALAEPDSEYALLARVIFHTKGLL